MIGLRARLHRPLGRQGQAVGRAAGAGPRAPGAADPHGRLAGRRLQDPQTAARGARPNQTARGAPFIVQ